MFGMSNKELAKRYVSQLYTRQDVYANHMNHMRELDMMAKREPAISEYIREIDDSLFYNLNGIRCEETP